MQTINAHLLSQARSALLLAQQKLAAFTTRYPDATETNPTYVRLHQRVDELTAEVKSLTPRRRRRRSAPKPAPPPEPETPETPETTDASGRHG